MNYSRRKFIAFIPAYLVGLGSCGDVIAQLAVRESDPQAQALGYVGNGLRVDVTKYPKYSPGQSCSTCALYNGPTGAASGGCALFSGKLVVSSGWCAAYAKKIGINTPQSNPGSPVESATPKQRLDIDNQLQPNKADPGVLKRGGTFDKNKQKCTRMGLTPGSDDYRLCIKSN